MMLVDHKYVHKCIFVTSFYHICCLVNLEGVFFPQYEVYQHDLSSHYGLITSSELTAMALKPTFLGFFLRKQSKL